MSVDPKLLEILRCPLTKQSLNPLSKEKIEEVNSRIEAGHVQYEDGSNVDQPIDEGLITANGSRIYRIDAGIPIMLHRQSIPVTEVESSDAKS